MTRTVDDAELQDILRSLDEFGYCIVPSVLPDDDIVSLRAALDRAAAEDDAAGTASRYGPTSSNQRVWALLNRGEEFVRLATHPLALAIVRARLGPDVLLTNISANITAPGGDREIGRLHTDQGYLPEPWPYLLATNVSWFLDDFTEDNGATLVVPGSHKLLTPPSERARAVGTGSVDRPRGGDGGARRAHCTTRRA